jgi:hypothetical protein
MRRNALRFGQVKFIFGFWFKLAFDFRVFNNLLIFQIRVYSRLFILSYLNSNDFDLNKM